MEFILESQILIQQKLKVVESFFTTVGRSLKVISAMDKNQDLVMSSTLITRFIWETLLTITEKAEESSNGLMVRYTMVNGKITKNQAAAFGRVLTSCLTSDNGKTTLLRVSVC